MKLLFSAKSSALGRFGLAVASILALTIGFAIASLLFVVLLGIGLTLGGWLWWRLRRLARHAQARRAAPEFLEGEYTVEPEPLALEDRRPPSTPPRRAP